MPCRIHSLQTCILVLFGIFSIDCAPKKNSLKKRLLEAEQLHDEIAKISRPTEQLVAASSGPAGTGYRQRLAHVEHVATEAAAAEPTPWTETLKRDWASGVLSAVKVQEYAAKSAMQGARHLDAISKTGTSGTHGSNVQRDLLKLFGRPVGAPEFDWFDAPTKSGRESHPFLLPHKMFSALYDERRDLFNRAVRGTVGATREYWEHLQDATFVKNHPLLTNFDATIPIGIHGDAGSFSKQDSLMVLSWNSVLGSGTTRYKRFVITFIRKSVYTKATLDRIMEIVAWSFNTMAKGTPPAFDWSGRPLPSSSSSSTTLAGPYTGVLCQVRGDWQFYGELFGFPAWNGALRMCWMCRASSTLRHLAFTDFGPGAEWRDTRFTDESWRRYMRGMGYPIPVLLALVIGLLLECIQVDALHAIDLGFGSHVIANTFWHTIKRHCWGKPNQDANAEALNADMVAWSKANHVSTRVQGKLTKERIRSTSDSGYPKLKVKGAACRHLAPYSLELAKRWQRMEGPHATDDALIVGINQLLVRMFHIFHTSSQFFTQPIKDELFRIGIQLPQMYGILYAKAAAAGLKLWKATPKLHLVQELLCFTCQVWGNPSYYWTYCDEDLVGFMIEIAESCHPASMSYVALVKWLVCSFDCDPSEE